MTDVVTVTISAGDAGMSEEDLRAAVRAHWRVRPFGEGWCVEHDTQGCMGEPLPPDGDHAVWVWATEAGARKWLDWMHDSLEALIAPEMLRWSFKTIPGLDPEIVEKVST